jgi:hypothetical protein
MCFSPVAAMPANPIDRSVQRRQRYAFPKRLYSVIRSAAAASVRGTAAAKSLEINQQFSPSPGTSPARGD